MDLTWEAATNEHLWKTIGKGVGELAFKSAIAYTSGPIGKLGMFMLGKRSVEQV